MSDWNKNNPERVREAQRRYAERRRARRATLSRLDKAREDLAKVLCRLTPAEQEEVLEWARLRILEGSSSGRAFRGGDSQ